MSEKIPFPYKHDREQRLKEVEAKRREILKDERGRGIFATWYTLPDDEGYDGQRPLGHLLFTASLSRKYDDIFYLYRMDNYDSHAYAIAFDQAEEELQTNRPQCPMQLKDCETTNVILTSEHKKYVESFCEWDDTVHKRAIEICRNGIVITPYFYINEKTLKNSRALVEVIAVVDVKEFNVDGIISAIHTFLDMGEIEWEGDPIVHIASEEFLRS